MRGSVPFHLRRVALVIACVTGWLAIGASAAFSCRTRTPPTYNGATTVFGWGANWYGQLSSPLQVEPRPYPVNVGNSRVNISKVAGGYMHVAMLDAAANEVWVAGLAASGQLAQGPIIGNRQVEYGTIPYIVDRVEPDFMTRPVFDVAGGFGHTCILTQKFNQTAPQAVAYCAGDNSAGQLGRTDVPSKVPYLLAVQSTDPTFQSASLAALASGPTHMLALTTSGALWAWGSNTFGELGNGATAASSSATSAPVRVTGLLQQRRVAKIGCGSNFCMAMEADGRLWGWGQNHRSQLGGASSKRAEPNPVVVVASGVSDFACGGAHVLAVINNRLHSWGDGTLGATGHPKNIPALVIDRWTVKTPTPVADFADVNIRSIAAGARHSLVLDTCGTVYTMGSDSLGQLGLEELVTRRFDFLSLAAKSNSNLQRRGAVVVAVHATWFNSFVIAEETPV